MLHSLSNLWLLDVCLHSCTWQSISVRDKKKKTSSMVLAVEEVFFVVLEWCDDCKSYSFTRITTTSQLLVGA